MNWLLKRENSYHTHRQWGEYPEMWRSSEARAAENQMTRPCGQCREVVHVTDNNDHECDQAYCNRCSEDVVLYLGYHCVLPEG